LFCALSLGLVYISNANPACSCVYICKFQFRPIHPPSRRLSNLCSVVLEEVMDAHSEHEVFARTVKSHHQPKFGKNSVKLSSISK
jgi:hypothetical protein